MHQAAHNADRLSALIELGFEKVDTTPIVTDAHRIDRKNNKVTSCRPAMGTYVSISALNRSKDRAEEAIGCAFEEMDRLAAILSRYEPSSAVSVLNGDGYIADAPAELTQVVGSALQLHKLSRGAFDISVQPLVDLFRESLTGEAPAPPTSEQMMSALALVDSGNIDLSKRAVSFRVPGMAITLDGIAKGYIVDKMAEVLKRRRVKNYLINAGGDIRTAGTKEKKQPWTVAVQDPTKHGDFPDVLQLKSAGVATSGSYEIYFDREKTFHHIVNTSTGRSPDVNSSVSVVAPSSMAADALATGIFVMDPETGIEFIDKFPRCACFIIDKDGRHHRSKRWKSAPLSNEKAGS